jgi:hypothetical protein
MKQGVPRLPTFLVIGAMKAGTTSLFHYLRCHPQIHMSETKEVMFFDPRHNWHRGVGWYTRQFVGAGPGVLAVGEASTSYTKYPEVDGVPERIASILDDPRLVYVVRDPVERMRSHYLHNLATGMEWRPMDEAFDANPMYLNISRYALQLERYLARFPADRILVVDAHRLRDDRVETLRSIFDFLGVDPYRVPASVETEFFRSSERVMRPAVIRRLRRVPRVRAAAAHVPGPIKLIGRRLPAPPLDLERGELSTALRARLVEALSVDVQRFRSYVGGGFDGWGIA